MALKEGAWNASYVEFPTKTTLHLARFEIEIVEDWRIAWWDVRSDAEFTKDVVAIYKYLGTIPVPKALLLLEVRDRILC
jgi:hypothetical protein